MSGKGESASEAHRPEHPIQLSLHMLRLLSHETIAMIGMRVVVLASATQSATTAIRKRYGPMGTSTTQTEIRSGATIQKTHSRIAGGPSQPRSRGSGNWASSLHSHSPAPQTADTRLHSLMPCEGRPRATPCTAEPGPRVPWPAPAGPSHTSTAAPMIGLVDATIATDRSAGHELRGSACR